LGNPLRVRVWRSGVGRDCPTNLLACIEPALFSHRLRRKPLLLQYEADRASASSHHYGRLAGFTNQKEVHRTREGLQPFALLRGVSGRSAPDGELLLRQAERALRAAIKRAAAAWTERPRPGRPPRPCNRQRPSSISAGSRS
jgi:hypothetical protein